MLLNSLKRSRLSRLIYMVLFIIVLFYTWASNPIHHGLELRFRMNRIKYTKGQLFGIKRSLWNGPLNKVDSQLCDTLRDFNIARERTSRGGRNQRRDVQRQIKPLIRRRDITLNSKNDRSNVGRFASSSLGNLTAVQTLNAQHSNLLVKFVLWNARSMNARGKCNRTLWLCLYQAILTSLRSLKHGWPIQREMTTL